jgi:hypothetical protein
MRTEPAGSFSVTVPAHGDEVLLDATLSSLLTTDDAPSEVLVVVDTGDPMARDAAVRAAARHPELVEVVDEAVSVDVVSDEPYARAHTPPSEGTFATHRGEPWWPSVRAAATAWWHARASPAAALTAPAAARLLARVRHLTLAGLPTFVAGAAVVVATLRASSLAYVPFAAVVFVLAAIAWTALMRTLHTRRAPPASATDRQGVESDSTASFSVTVPAHSDEAALEATVAEFVTGDDEPV